jgi:hypothetical protein
LPFLKPDKQPELCSSYRPIALTSILGKLIKRLVVTRLQYRLEQDGILSVIQSRFRRGRCSTDSLMQLVSDIMLDFEAKPHEPTVAVKLDLASAFSRVDHVHLLNLFKELSIPSV